MNSDDLALSFNSIADEYDQYRSGYPEELVEYVLSLLAFDGKPPHICEIGTGTGHATVSFAERGCSIVAVDPGVDLLSRAKEKLSSFSDVEFICATFEEAQLSASSFDLVIASQSFHWVDPEIGYKKIAEILKPGGVFAAFWKLEAPSEDRLHQALDEIYQKYMPDYQPVTASQYEKDVIDYFDSLVSSRMFRGCQLRRYFSDPETTECDSFVSSISTWSKIAALPVDTRAKLQEELRATILSHGGKVVSGLNETILVCGFLNS